MLRKVAVAAASKPHVEIRQDGDQFYIKTSTTVRTTEINFKVGEGFEEETVDGRKCRVRPQRPHLLPGYPFQPLARCSGRFRCRVCHGRFVCPTGPGLRRKPYSCSLSIPSPRAQINRRA